MRKFNKKVMSLASIAAILASFAAMPASAEERNVYSVSYETLTTAITTEDGSTVPAGTVAVTMSINNNSGFNANTLTLDIDEGYSVITNNDGKPILDKGAVLANSLTSASVSNDEETLCVVSASATTSYADGELFTVYFFAENTTTDFVSIDDTEAEIALGIIPLANDYVMDSYFVGDTNGEDWIVTSTGRHAPVDAVDAANIMVACCNYGRPFDIFNETDSVIWGYFPDLKHREALDVNNNNACDNRDANDILDYAAEVGAGNPYSGPIGHEIIFYRQA
ncbi:MAG: hypothetical protein IKK51_08260 [Oscillospiraceae bacterium]|nr:hypothetical protein [Oscillospiraceae bacterium]